MKIALFEPQIPENTGNIIRLSACFNLDLCIIGPCGFVFDNKRLSRSVMDYYHLANVVMYNNWEHFITDNLDHRLVLATTKSKLPYYSFEYSKNDILLMGNESSGVPKFVHEYIKNQVNIPVSIDARSLNLSVATGIIASFALYKLGIIP